VHSFRGGWLKTISLNLRWFESAVKRWIRHTATSIACREWTGNISNYPAQSSLLTWPKSDPQLVTGNWQTWQQPAGKFSFWRIFWHTLCCTDQRCLWVPFFSLLLLLLVLFMSRVLGKSVIRLVGYFSMSVSGTHHMVPVVQPRAHVQSPPAARCVPWR